MKYLYAGGNFHLTDHMKLQVQYCNILRKNIDLQRFCANCEQMIFLVSDTQKFLCNDARFYFYKKEKEKKKHQLLKNFSLETNFF